MVPTPQIVQRLKLDGTVASLVAGLVADYDIRRDTNPDYFDIYKNIKLCLAIDDAGELPRFGAPRAALQDVFYVWCFAPETAAGRTAIRQLVPAVIRALDNWQVTETRQLITYTRQRLGAQAGSITGSNLDRLIFTANGTHLGVGQ
jgi:hypothetical protein